MRTFILSLFLLGAPCVQGAAVYTLQIGNVSWTGGPGGYDCFSETAYPNTVNFSITKNSPGNRAFAVTAGPSAATGDFNRQLVSGAGRLNYQLYTSSDLSYALKAPPVAIPSEVITGRPDHPQQTIVPLSFTLYIPPHQLVLAGTYSDQVTVSVYKSIDDLTTLYDTRTITISAVVSPGAALAVVPSGSAFTSSTSQHLNFGRLATGQSLGCDLLVRKNTGCNITFSSRNGGVMRLIPTPTADQVPYSCTVNGNLLNLVNPALINLPGGLSPSQDGNRLPVSITVGDLGDAAAGDYQDEIMITVVAF